jgi:hypothetical protein
MKKPGVVAIFALIFTALVILGISLNKPKTTSKPSKQNTVSSAPVNLINVKERPYVSLKPLTSRNDLEFTVHNLPKKSDSVEVTLEYDRNKGVMDAVVKQFNLDKIPAVETIFLGTKSAGGHITYHDDVIGGSMILKFTGTDPYNLKVPWRYSDTEKEYQNLSSTDGFFQAVLESPIKQSKVLIMQSPGVPEGLTGDIAAGPYLIATLGDLPKTQVQLTLRLPETATVVTLWGYDGAKWHELKSTLEIKAVTAKVDLYPLYVVTK